MNVFLLEILYLSLEFQSFWIFYCFLKAFLKIFLKVLLSSFFSIFAWYFLLFDCRADLKCREVSQLSTLQINRRADFLKKFVLIKLQLVFLQYFKRRHWWNKNLFAEILIEKTVDTSQLFERDFTCRLFLEVTSLKWSTRNFTTLKWPRLAASCKGVA